jgi:hypothetical protein
MATKEQVAAIAKLVGRQTEEKFVLNHECMRDLNDLETRHKADMVALYERLGLPIPGAPVATDGGENSPPDVAPGQVIAIPPPPLPNVPIPRPGIREGDPIIAGAPPPLPNVPIPRPLKDRK